MLDLPCNAAFFIAHRIPGSGARFVLDFVEGERGAALTLQRSDAAALPAALERLRSRDPAEAAGCCAARTVFAYEGFHPVLSLTLHFRPGPQRLSLALAVRRTGSPRGVLTLAAVGHALAVDAGSAQIDLAASPAADLEQGVEVRYLHARAQAVDEGPATVLLYAPTLAGAEPLWLAGSVW